MNPSNNQDVAALQALCERAGGFKAVADAIDVNDQSIYQIVTRKKLPYCRQSSSVYPRGSVGGRSNGHCRSAAKGSALLITGVQSVPYGKTAVSVPAYCFSVSKNLPRVATMIFIILSPF